MTTNSSLTPTARRVLTLYAKSEHGTLAVHLGTAASLLSMYRKGYLQWFKGYAQWQITPAGREAISDGE